MATLPPVFRAQIHQRGAGGSRKAFKHRHFESDPPWREVAKHRIIEIVTHIGFHMNQNLPTPVLIQQIAIVGGDAGDCGA